MNTLKTLVLKFDTSDKSNRSITIKNPKADLADDALLTTMNAIVELGIFDDEGVNPYAGVDSAEYVERTVTPIIEREA